MITHRTDVKGLRVLAVDDEPALGKIVSRLLAMDGHTVVVVRSVEEALAELAEDRFDVVLSDLGLGPGAEAGGWELAEYVAARCSGTRFLLATGWGPQIDPTMAATRGVHGIVSKPYKLKELRTIVADAS